MGARTEPTAAEKAASEWVVRLDSPDATPADRLQFRSWLRADPGNPAAYEAVKRTWRKLDGVKRVRSHVLAPRLHRPWRTPLAGALAVAAMALIAILVSRPPELSAPTHETAYATRTGEQRSISLPDGSTMELDAATEVRVAFTPAERRVTLRSGTALFDVRRNPDRPFIVRTELGSIRVLGTSFVVRVGESGVRTTVLRGLVRGEPRERGILGMLDRRASEEGDAVIARANEEIFFGASNLEVSPIPARAVERRLAWREGMLAFDGERLRDAAAEVTRHTGVVFEFADAGIADTRIGGYISASDADDFLELLQSGLDIHAERLTPTRIRLVREPMRTP